ncbi:hypothetical protein QNH14_02660 [Apirhabdus apintestini]|nr:hypothetical protein QNH14_02660 [Enterobacteriaceae bacterium CA-0114]
MTATQSPMVMLRELAEKALDEVTTQLGKARTAHRKAVEQARSTADLRERVPAAVSAKPDAGDLIV